MGYHVKKMPRKQSVPAWKVQFISFKKVDVTESTAKKPKREWDIHRSRWSALGFSVAMTYDEAKTRAAQLNAQGHLRRQEAQLQKAARAQFELQTRATAALPPEFVEEFEERFIHQRDVDPERRRRKTRKVYVRWRAAQRLILSVAADPSEWFCQTHAFYDFFYREKLTIKYANAILGLANLWGFFICRKLGRPFLPVPIPRGYERLRIFEANLDKSSGVTRASLPISPIDLAGARRGLNRSNLNWLTLSVWFGLRPKEVDSLLDANKWRVEVLSTGRQLLWVFQTKLVGLPTEDRWKPIPILFDEQRFALEIGRSGTFRRPLVKTMRRHFGDGVTLYGGRKGFTDLMLSRGQSLENISVWMGHSSIQRTWQSYKDRRRFHVAGF